MGEGSDASPARCERGEEYESVKRVLEREDYKALPSRGQSYAEVFGAAPSADGWYAPDESAWVSLSLRQRLAAVDLSKGWEIDRTAFGLGLRAGVIKSWLQIAAFQVAVEQRKRHPLGRPAVAAMYKAHKGGRNDRLRSSTEE